MARIVAEVVSDAGRSMLKTAETEKYPHVTYFFNGGAEVPYPGEERILIPSQQVATYDLAPEMSAAGVTDALCTSIDSRAHDFYLCNFANADMVGHSGSLDATLRAVETVDRCLARILESARRSRTRLIITADHGNAEQMIDPETGGPQTAHTTNPVPFIVAAEHAVTTPNFKGDARRFTLSPDGALQDIAPTMLGILGLPQPKEMTGRDLRVIPANNLATSD
jgi:2,3-bisphosphoglycerate-independent phosphoglycerate mutase